MSDEIEETKERLQFVAAMMEEAFCGAEFAVHVLTPEGASTRVHFISNMSKARHLEAMRSFVRRETGAALRSMPERADAASAALGPAIEAMFAADLDPAHIVTALMACASGMAAALGVSDVFAEAAIQGCQALEADAAARHPAGNA